MQGIRVGAYQFDYICDIKPDHVDGKVTPLFPQEGYTNSDDLPLHQYGAGPFCHFTISRLHSEGVYLIQVDGVVKYVGECESLSTRFNAGYGNISPRNCFVGGQATNCRINNYIFEMSRKNCEIQLFFYETTNRFAVESELIGRLNPEWNISRGKYRMQNYRTQTRSPKNVGTQPDRQRDELPSNNRITCRDEVLSAAQSIVEAKGFNRFTVTEVVKFMMARHTQYPESTIRTHIISRCCVNAPNHHATVFNGFRRVERGLYKLHGYEM